MMSIPEIIGYGGGICAFIKAGSYSKEFEKLRGAGEPTIRDGLVLMKNGLVARGVFLAILGCGLSMVACSLSLGSFGLLSLLPLVVAGVLLYAKRPRKVESNLLEHGYSVEEVDYLLKSFAFYNLTMTGIFFAVSARMIVDSASG